jgi:hypothetical protein
MRATYRELVKEVKMPGIKRYCVTLLTATGLFVPRGLKPVERHARDAIAYG